MHASKDLLTIIALGSVAIVNAQTQWPVQSYQTEPFHFPVFNITKTGLPLDQGLIFITPEGTFADSTLVENAQIADDDGNLIWSSSIGGPFFNLLVQQLNNQSVLTYWNGSGTPAGGGHGYGRVSILDRTYTEIYNICPDLGLLSAPNGTVTNGSSGLCQADLHEQYLTDRGTLLVTAYNITQTDLTSVGGASDGWILDSLFFELDLETSETLFSWSALANVPISDSQLPFSSGDGSTQALAWDFFHINSIQLVGDDYLINSRHLWTVFLLDSTGEILWTLNGSDGGDFSLPPDGNFAWEHQARIQSTSTANTTILTLFDNANDGTNDANQTRGLEFSLDHISKSATLLKNFFDPLEPLYADSQGSFTALNNGNFFQGFGQLPVIKEYTPNGLVALSIQWADLAYASSYRAFRFPWFATPKEDPVAVAKPGTVWVSWNGATNVTDWVIYEGRTAASLVKTKTIAKIGFESNTTISNATSFVQVAAFDGSQWLRNSSVVAISLNQSSIVG